MKRATDGGGRGTVEIMNERGRADGRRRAGQPVGLGIRHPAGTARRKARSVPAGKPSVWRRVDLTQVLTLGAVLVSLAFAIPQYVSGQATLESARSASRTQEQQQITERFSKAVEQLGTHDNLEVRLGGIYSLERIARDSVADQPTVVNVLTAFVRETTKPGGFVPADVQAALTVLGQRHPLPTDPVIDLTGANLSGADLRGAHLAGAHLSGAHLDLAELPGADLTGAQLDGTNLSGADLARAHLDGAHLDGDLDLADLTGAHLTGAELDDALLTRAHFNGADLTGADLTGANLDGADLTGALLTRAELPDAKLDGVVGLPPR